MRIARLFALFTFLLSACSAASPGADAPLHVLATTDIIADVVQQVGGEQIALETLIPSGSDPHAFSPAPRDAVRISQADILFLNGLGLEASLQPVLENLPPDALRVELAQGIAPLQMDADPHADAHDSPEGAADPHIWTDPNNVRAWLPLIVEALSQRDPAHAALYRQRADAYAAQLDALDAWIREQVASIPQERRILVSDHLVWGYFGERYGFSQQAALIPGFSTLTQPSARDLAALEDNLRKTGVPVIFVGNTVNPALAERVAADTGVQLVTLYTGSLGPAEDGADTYLGWMRYNVRAIVHALR
ncbi:MAG: zinc ABC transporter substrate-binding protein [Anaerolineae bacterium]|nr:MAG: zinc ABC transporter substrate-binding protein [Anaerolineae bacterium]